MRIIAGTARSLPLKAPSGMDTRPTSDRIKETLFNILNPRLPGSQFLDLFAGSGQMGLEAVSRGAKRAVFVENNKKAAQCIEGNIAFTKFSSQCMLMVRDAVSAVRWMEGRERFDLVFLDPPYGKGLEADVLRVLAGSSLITGESLVVLESSIELPLSGIEELGFAVVREKRYKKNQHVFLQRDA
ncbi:16S rRNA (guanine(966)-N(2))-methyltransferase RsmD [Lachnospiraceae bacterium 29-84]